MSTTACALVSPSRPRRIVHFRDAGRNQPRTRCAVIPPDHPVIDPEGRVGKSQILIAILGDALEHAAPVVGEISGAALKRRQPFERVAPVCTEQRTNLRQRVARDDAHAVARVMDLRPRALALHDRNRVRGQKK